VERITGPFLKYRNASSTYKKTDMAASCVTKLSQGPFELRAIDIAQPAICFASPNNKGAACYSSSSIWMVPLEGKGNEKDGF